MLGAGWGLAMALRLGRGSERGLERRLEPVTAMVLAPPMAEELELEKAPVSELESVCLSAPGKEEVLELELVQEKEVVTVPV